MIGSQAPWQVDEEMVSNETISLTRQNPDMRARGGLWCGQQMEN